MSRYLNGEHMPGSHPEGSLGMPVPEEPVDEKALLREAAERAIEIEAKWAEAASRDAAFDAGEFSGPASARAAEREIEAMAAEYPFSVEEINREIGVIAHEGEEEMYEAIRNGSFEG